MGYSLFMRMDGRIGEQATVSVRNECERRGQRPDLLQLLLIPSREVIRGLRGVPCQQAAVDPGHTADHRKLQEARVKCMHLFVYLKSN